MDAAPVPVGLKQCEAKGVFPGTEDTADQAVPLFHAPKMPAGPSNIEMMQRMSVCEGNVRHC
jgi:hypothetical protein